MRLRQTPCKQAIWCLGLAIAVNAAFLGERAVAQDCNNNGVPDFQEVNPADPDGDGMVSEDCNYNRMPDECDLLAQDCNGNGIVDACELGNQNSARIFPAAGSPTGSQLGRFVAIDGDLAAIGYGDGEHTFVFRKVGTQWIQEAAIATPGSDHVSLEAYYPYQQLAISGETIVVGAPTLSIEIDGTAHSGGAYVLEKVNGVWQIVATLVPAIGASGRFGLTVDIDGSRIVVGAPLMQTPWLENNTRAGAVFVFEKVQDQWQETATISSDFGYSPDNWFSSSWFHRFGTSVAIDGDTIAIGAERGWINGIEAPQGAVFVASQVAHGDWQIAWQAATPTGSLSSSSQTSTFGSKVDIDGDTLVVGAPFFGDGTLFVFERCDSAWVEVQRISGSGSATSAVGVAFALQGDMLLCSGRSFDNAFSAYLGLVELYRRESGVWRYSNTLRTSSEPSFQGDIRRSLALSEGGTALVGAENALTFFSSRGAAFVFDLNRSTFDCDEDDILDACEIADCPAGWLLCADCNQNGALDRCDPDSNGDGVPDDCEIANCAVGDLPCADCNSNGIPDGCEADCDGDGVIDVCAIANCPSGDMTCQDCNQNGLPDVCELDGNDCNGNQILDECDVVGTGGNQFSWPDCNGNGLLDFCEGIAADCNQNLISDLCEIRDCPDGDLSCADCNANGVFDVCESTADCNANGIPDECEMPGQFAAFGPSAAAPANAASYVAMSQDVLAIADISTDVAHLRIYRKQKVGWVIEFEGPFAPPGCCFSTFGSVATDGETVVVGLPVTQDYQGLVLVYEMIDGAWEQTQHLELPEYPEVNPFTTFGDGALFGYRVAVQGDELFVTAPTQEYLNDPVLPNPNPVQGSGVIYRYERQSCGWAFQDKIVPNDHAKTAGIDLDLHDDTLVISSYMQPISKRSPFAFVIERIGGTWQTAAKIPMVFTPYMGDYNPLELPSLSVAIHGDTIVIGNRGQDLENLGFGTIYRRIDEGWEQTQILEIPNGVDLNVVEVPLVHLSEDFLAVAVDLRDDDGTYTREIFIYRQHEGFWFYDRRLSANNLGTSTEFSVGAGPRIAVDGDRLVVPTQLAGNLVQAAYFELSGSDCNENDVPDHCDGSLLDIQTFVDALLETATPGHDTCLYDFVRDGRIDGKDIMGFIDALAGG